MPLIGSIAYLFIDAGMQAKNGSGEYVAPYDFIYFLVIFFILFIAYLLIYLFSVFMFYRRRKDEGENELITVKMTTNLGVGNEEIKKFTKLTKASMVDNDSIEVTPMVPKYSYLYVCEDSEQLLTHVFKTGINFSDIFSNQLNNLIFLLNKDYFH